MLFRKKIQRSCLYCANGAVIPGDRVVCAKKGIVSSGSPCRKFSYDPLKRVPPRRKAVDFQQYDKEDYSL